MGRKMINLMNGVGNNTRRAGLGLLGDCGLFEDNKLVMDQVIRSCGRR